ncbi:MAG: T9SS type A sorting domain-containing protein [Bacteroidetes bacterium]|nr:T9SS type A sorting domain-containing protein [Bacteroidota bacterium]
MLTDTTVYYVQATDVYGGAQFSGGSAYHTGTNQYSGGTTNAKTYFDVINSCTLQSVKVYTDTPGDRNIQLYDNTGAVIYNQVITVNPDTQVITLNWTLTPGTDYAIGTDEAYNLNIAGWNQVSPRFRRTNGGGIVYPYTIPNLVTITGNDLLNNFYYYFYDWKVKEAELNCTSALVPVTVYVGTTGLAELAQQGISIYPNPANDVLHIDLKNASEINFTITDFMGKVIKRTNFSASSNLIDVKTLSQGVYHLSMNTNGQHFVYRFVKQ